MTFEPLPRTVNHLLVPPIKCQGIKTKLVPFILENIRWDGRGRWIEPFLGSGVVLLNVQPPRALINDSNPHIITLYKRIYSGDLTPQMVGEHLAREGANLAANGEDHYYAVRQRFNEQADPLDFLFLNRSCFNGVMRFNKKGAFNVPFCRKTDRFRRAYITKIVNQVKAIRDVMLGKDWEFRIGDWRDCLDDVEAGDFVYLDPPYIGRHTDYYSQWSESDAIDLARAAQALPCGVALSMWRKNRYRLNTHIDDHWKGMVERTFAHFYHVGPTEDFRNAMEEALLIKPGYAVHDPQDDESVKTAQMLLPFGD